MQSQGAFGPVILDRPTDGKAWQGDHWVKITLATAPRVWSILPAHHSPVAGPDPDDPLCDSAIVSYGTPYEERAMTVGDQSVWTSSLQSDPGADEFHPFLPFPSRTLRYDTPGLETDHGSTHSTSPSTSFPLLPSPCAKDEFDRLTWEELESIKFGSIFRTHELEEMVMRLSRLDLLRKRKRSRETSPEEEPPAKRYMEFPINVDPVVPRETVPLELYHRDQEGAINPYILPIVNLDLNPPHELHQWHGPVDVLIIPPLGPERARSPFIDVFLQPL